MTRMSTGTLERLPWPVASQVARLLSAEDYVLPDIGSKHAWPAVLHHGLTTLFNSTAPMLLLWGERGLLLFNDAFAHLHPTAWNCLGVPAEQLLSGEALGYLRQVYHSSSAQVETACVLPSNDHEIAASYNLAMVPLLGAHASVVGVLCTLQVCATSQVSTSLRDQVGPDSYRYDLGQHTQKMEALGHLTGGIAHDFNNALTGIIGSLEMAQWQSGKASAQQVAKYLDRALTSAQRAASLTRRLMVFSHKEKFTPAALNLNQELVNMQELLNSHCGERIRVKIDVAADLWKVSCDLSQLENAVLNLVLNARDAMPEGGEIRVRAYNQSVAEVQRDLSDGDYVCLQVIDNGFGMSAQTVEHVFEPFFTTKDVGKGTGLGLAMVYSFAQQAQGAVKLSSTLGLGTQVRLYLPRFHAPTLLRAGPVVVEPEMLALVEKYRVLVVEDQTNVRRLVVEVLEELGCDISQAENADQALAHLDACKHCDLLLTDIGLPGISGRELAERARALLPELKVLFMTGYAFEGKSLDDGGETAVLAKPFSVGQLRHQVSEMLSV